MLLLAKDEKRTHQIEMLKWLAVATMLIDHTGYILFSQTFELRLIGRLSFPLFCLVIAYRLFEKPGREIRYLKRLLIWAVISQIPFWVAFGSNREFLGTLNIMFTLAAGVLVSLCLDYFEALRRAGARLQGYSSLRSLFAASGIVAALLLGLIVDYHVAGVLFIPLLVRVLRYDFSHLAWWLSGGAFVANFAVHSVSIFSGERMYLFLMPLASLLVGYVVHFVFRHDVGKMPRLPGWMFYAFYPVHISCLIALAVYLHFG